MYIVIINLNNKITTVMLVSHYVTDITANFTCRPMYILIKPISTLKVSEVKFNIAFKI